MGRKISYTKAYRYARDNNSDNVSKYGYLYNWPAVMHGARSSESNPSGVQGICPKGWHVPSDAEWSELTNYVKSKSEYVCGNGEENIAKSLASKEGWESSDENYTVGNNPSANNATGFSALPAGCYASGYISFGYNADFWSATENSDYFAYSRYLYYSNAGVFRDYGDEFYGFSVRCVRD